MTNSLKQRQMTWNKDFSVLEQEIKVHLIKQLNVGKMTVKQVAEVCFLLGHAKTAQGLQFLIDNLQNDFDVLGEIKEEQDSKEDQKTDQIVQKYISHLIKIDPLQASQVGLMAAQEGITLEKLIEKYPDLKNFI